MSKTDLLTSSTQFYPTLSAVTVNSNQPSVFD